MATKPLYGANDVGCWFDGSRGGYLGEAIIDEAVVHGFVIDDIELATCERYSELEFYYELTDKAEEFMQQFAADGFWFGSQPDSGDWGLWPCEEDDE